MLAFGGGPARAVIGIGVGINCLRRGPIRRHRRGDRIAVRDHGRPAAISDRSA